MSTGFREKFLPLFLFAAIYSAVFWLTASIFHLIFPFILGFIIASLIQPLTRFLSKKLKWNESLSALLTSLIAYVIILGIMFLLGYFILTEIATLISKLNYETISYITDPIIEWINDLGVYINKIDANFVKENQRQIIDIAQTALGVVSSLLRSMLAILTSIPTIFTTILVMVFATYFFSKDMDHIKSNLSSLFSASTRSNLSSAWHQGVIMLGKYTRSYFVIYSLTFVETLIVFSLLDIKYPLLLSIITGICDVIPVIGPIVIYVPVALVAFASGSVGKGVGVLAAYVVIAIVRQIIEPKIVADSIDIHPLAMLAAIYVGLQLGSIAALIYVSFFLFLYKLLIRVGILKSPFKPKEKEKKKKWWMFAKNKIKEE